MSYACQSAKKFFRNGHALHKNIPLFFKSMALSTFDLQKVSWIVWLEAFEGQGLPSQKNGKLTALRLPMCVPPHGLVDSGMFLPRFWHRAAFYTSWTLDFSVLEGSDHCNLVSFGGQKVAILGYHANFWPELIERCVVLFNSGFDAVRLPKCQGIF